MATLRACTHKLAQPTAGRSQPRCSAGHSSPLRSADQPGRCSQPTATQRLPPGGATDGNCDDTGAGSSARGGAASGGGGGAVLQPASDPRIAATPMPSRRGTPMGLLLLEALLALGLLVLIVWWVMFAGRRRGERDDPGSNP